MRVAERSVIPAFTKWSKPMKRLMMTAAALAECNTTVVLQ